MKHGRILPGALPPLLREVYVGRATGTLRFERGAEWSGVRFVRGHIVYGEASAERLHMGEVLVQEGLLDAEQLQRATALVQRERLRLGQALERLGIVDAELLEEFLGFHVRAILVDVLSWGEGQFAFDEQDAEVGYDYDFPLKMSTGELVLDAVRHLNDREGVRFGLGDLERVVLPATEPLVRFQRIALTPIDAFVLSRVDGTLSAREIVEYTPLPPEAIEQSLLALLATGFVEYASDAPKARERPVTTQLMRQEIEEAYARSESRNPFEVLAVAYEATDAEVKATFLRLAKRYHPDVHHDALADQRDRLEHIFFRLNDAYRDLADARSRVVLRARWAPDVEPAAARPPQPAAPEGLPSEMYRRAEERFAEGKYWEAVALTQEVVRLGEGRQRTKARVLLARAYLKHSGSVTQAEQELLEAIREDAASADAHFHLGQVYRRTDRRARAVAMFRRVLELRPKHREATAELESLGPAAAEKPSLFKRLLGG